MIRSVLRFAMMPTMVIGACSLLARDARAQIPVFSFELRGGAAIGSDTDDEGIGEAPTELGSGSSFDATFALRTRNRFALVFGFGERRVGCDSDACAPDSDIVATGFDLGLRLAALPRAPVTPWIGVGARTQKAVVEIVAGDEPGGERTSDRFTTLEAGVGLFWRVGDRFALSPGARYFRGTADFEELGRMPLRGFVVDLGLVLAF